MMMLVFIMMMIIMMKNDEVMILITTYVPSPHSLLQQRYVGQSTPCASDEHDHKMIDKEGHDYVHC